MEQLKEILKQIVADLEKSAAAIESLKSGENTEVTALDLAVQKNRDFYHSLRKQIGELRLPREKTRSESADPAPLSAKPSLPAQFAKSDLPRIKRPRI